MSMPTSRNSPAIRLEVACASAIVDSISAISLSMRPCRASSSVMGTSYLARCGRHGLAAGSIVVPGRLRDGAGAPSGVVAALSSPSPQRTRLAARATPHVGAAVLLPSIFPEPADSARRSVHGQARVCKQERCSSPSDRSGRSPPPPLGRIGQGTVGEFLRDDGSVARPGAPSDRPMAEDGTGRGASRDQGRPVFRVVCMRRRTSGRWPKPTRSAVGSAVPQPARHWRVARSVRPCLVRAPVAAVLITPIQAAP